MTDLSSLQQGNPFANRVQVALSETVAKPMPLSSATISTCLIGAIREGPASLACLIAGSWWCDKDSEDRRMLAVSSSFWISTLIWEPLPAFAWRFLDSRAQGSLLQVLHDLGLMDSWLMAWISAPGPEPSLNPDPMLNWSARSAHARHSKVWPRLSCRSHCPIALSFC